MKPQHFNICAVDTNHYHVYIRIAHILASDNGEIEALAAWFLSRNKDDVITLIWEEAMAGSLENNKPVIQGFATLFNAIDISPAKENIQAVITQVFSGVAAYFTLLTPRVHWSRMGYLYFDGWKRGRQIDDMDIGLRSRWRWIESLLDRARNWGWLSEDGITKIRAGEGVWIRKTQ